MTVNLDQASIPMPRYDSPGHADVPSWWRAEPERFAALLTTRLRIHGHEKAAAKKMVSVLAVLLALIVSLYSMDAIGAVAGIPSANGYLTLCAAIAFPAAIAWFLDRRLLQQLSDIDLRSRLWLNLVDAVKHGCVDLERLESPTAVEGEIERLLRKEIAIAARFLASRKTLAPQLPLFGHCFTLGSN